MRRLLMLDSGAFGIWSKGHTVDLAEYAAFCAVHSATSYFVSLDVIPGRPQDKITALRPRDVESACVASWKNYQDLLRKLPLEKVIPVFHQGEDFKWLKRYQDFGTPYLGLSFTSLRRGKTRDKKRWLVEVFEKLTNSGKPLPRLHGFAVTSWPLMQALPWHSVDSTTWKVTAARGYVFVPRCLTNGSWDYSRSPHVVRLSPAISSGTQSDIGGRLGARLLPTFKYRQHRGQETIRAFDYLDEIGIPRGAWQEKAVKKNYDLSGPEEIWLDRPRGLVQCTQERGAITTWEWRAIANARYMKEATRHLPVKHIYYAGAARKEIESELGKRLMTFVDVRSGEGTGNYQVFTEHEQRIQDKETW